MCVKCQGVCVWNGKIGLSPIVEEEGDIIPRAPNDVPYSRSVFEARVRRLLAFDGDIRCRFGFIRDEIALWIRNGWSYQMLVTLTDRIFRSDEIINFIRVILETL